MIHIYNYNIIIYVIIVIYIYIYIYIYIINTWHLYVILCHVIYDNLLDRIGQAIYMVYMIYIYMVFTTEEFPKVAIENWPE